MFRGGGDVAQDPEPVLGPGDACEPAGDLLLDLRGAQASFGVVGRGRDAQVVDEAQDVVLAVAEGFQQQAGLPLAGPVAVAGGGGQADQDALLE
jgi:hypothetical protein